MNRFQITPNTGHHSFWIPFDEEAMASLNPEDRAQVFAWTHQIDGWVQYFDKRHIRYQWAMSPTGELAAGWFVVIESNLGDYTRGAVYSPGEPVAASPFTGQPPSNYAYSSESEIPESRREGPYNFHVTFRGQQVTLLTFEVEWTMTMATDPIPVDLLIDFGNSRTTAVLLEQIPGASDGTSTSALRRIIQPLYFFSRDSVLLLSKEMLHPAGSHMIDSWFVLSKSRFADFELPKVSEDDLLKEYAWKTVPGKKSFFGKTVTTDEKVTTSVTRRMPQTFVELSPVCFGPGASNSLGACKPQGGGIQMHSSPKRYAWANDSLVDEGTPFWAMIRNLWDEDAVQNAKLEGQTLRFFPHDGTNWDITDPPSLWEPSQRPSCQPVSPNYPKADSLAWMALGILEAAYRWINCREYSKENLSYVKRFIRSVKLTYPSGWSKEELDAYKQKWVKAVNIFHLGHQTNAQPVPEVDFPLDEAIASQLPFIFSEIEAMHGIGENYIDLVGKQRTPNQPASLRTLNIDIGGGTTDYAVVEYSDLLSGSGVDLEAKVHFKDATNIAGDEVVKALIERVVLPAYGKHLAEEGDNYIEAFSSFFREPFKSSVIREEWKRTTLGFLVPQAIRCLKFLSSSEEILDLYSKDLNETDLYGFQDIAEKAREFFKKQGLDAVTVDRDFRFTTKASGSDFLTAEVTKEEISKVIRDVLYPVIKRLTKFISAFDVDIVIISGKSSEAPVVREMVLESFPITSDRLIAAKNFHCGDWYPFAQNGRISDAKTVTVVGLALSEAIYRKYIPGWSMKGIIPDSINRKNYWLLLPLNTGQDPTVILNPSQEEATVDVYVNAKIARKLFPTTEAPEPSYALRWRSKESTPPSRIKATFKRNAPKGNLGSELLTMVSAIDISTQLNIPKDHLTLEICTIQNEEYWLDSPRFDIRWPLQEETQK